MIIKKVKTKKSHYKIPNIDPKEIKYLLESGVTVIPKGDVLLGSIHAKGNLLVCGRVEGNLVVEKDLLLTGRVNGNVNCESGRFENCNVEGDIVVSGVMLVDKTTTILGDIVTDTMISDGHTKGNILAKSLLYLQKNASATGDVESCNMQMEEGAVHLGKLIRNIK